MDQLSGAFAARGAVVFLSVCLVSGVASAQEATVADAAKAHDLRLVQTRLATGGAVNAPLPDGATAMHWAAHWDDLQMAEALIRARANVNAADAHGITPLHLAAMNASARMGALLLKAGASAKAARSTGETVLMRAAWTGNADLVGRLIAAGADVNAREPRRAQTALMWAASQRHPEVVRALVRAAADVIARSSSGFTPLLFAAREGDVESIRILLAAGADPNEAAPNGANALIAASFRGKVQAAIALLEAGANPNSAPMGFTALHFAAGSWETELSGARGLEAPPDHEWASIRGLEGAAKAELIKALLTHGADVNARLQRQPPRIGFSRAQQEGRNLTGATPFLLAARATDIETMRTLLAAGADPKLGTDQGVTPLMFAAGLGRIMFETLTTPESTMAAVSFLLEHGADVKAVSADGETSLHAAASIRDDRLVERLVAGGADIHATDKRGRTPLVVAETTIVYLGENRVEKSSTGDVLRRLGATR